MTTSQRSRPTGGDDDEALLADLFDALLQDVQDGKTPDAASLLPGRPDLQPRVRETIELAFSVSGRREPGKPVLGGYEIVRELGRGGMGTVYLARHEALGREVAIKVLPQSLALSARAKRRFLEEARSLARLRHEHIVHIHRIVDHSEMLAFEMEFVEGPSLQSLIVGLRGHGQAAQLQQLIHALGPTAVVTARSAVEYFVRLGIAIARALGEVHRRGLVHRDVKPSNILLRKSGTPVLADFGLAHDSDPAATQTVSFAGTPIYAAPERLRHGDLGLDGRADVYSLGVTLYEAITLTPPYQGRSTQEVLRKIESGAVVPLKKRAPHVARDLQTVLQKAMEPDPRHRYATADAFADDLERLLSLQPIQARPKGLLRRLSLFAQRQRRVVVAGSAGAVLVALLAWPVLAHARAAATARERAEGEVRAAHQQLLQPECIDLLAWNAGETVRGVDVGRQTQALQRVIATYDAALQLEPDPGVQRERAAVVCAHWLRTHPPGHARSGTADDPAAFDAALTALPPVTMATARMLADGAVDLPELRQRLTSASAEDRFAAGLLAAMVGDLATCEAAWSPLDGAGFEHPLLDAGLGRLYAADGLPERAYPRLFHAMRAFPGAPALAIELADVALATGDLRLAEQWLAHPAVASVPEDADQSLASVRRQRVAADLLAARGDGKAAEAAYREILVRSPRDLVVRHRLACLAAERGDLARARQHLTKIVAERPDHAEAHLDLARLALHDRDRAAYFAEARWAAARGLGGEASSGTAEHLREIVRLGGLFTLHAAMTAGTGQPRRGWRRVEPTTSLWRSAADLARVEYGLRLLADWDRTAARALALLQNPLVATLHAWPAFLAQHGELLRPLPAPLVAGLALAWPLVLDAPHSPSMHWLLELQTNLGTPIRFLDFRPMLTGPPPPDGIDYGRSIATLGFVDGTEELLIAGVTRRGARAEGWVEIRAASTGELRHVVEAPGDRLMFGYSLADLGDVDGDGLHDFAIGAPQARGEAKQPAAVFVHSGRDGSLLRTLHGTDQAAFGVALTDLPDVDADGVPDLAVGSLPFARSPMVVGSVSVFSLRTGMLLRTHHSDRGGSGFGAALADAGDLDGDGVHDLVVGGNPGGLTPLVRVFSGKTGEPLRTLEDDVPSHDFGRVVLGIGDLDGDSVPDIAVAAPDVDGRSSRPGRVVLFSGRSGAPLFELQGDAADDRFGAALCVLPDWQGNGVRAIAIGALQGGISGNGYARVYALDRRMRPLQSFFVKQRRTTFGTPLVCLGEHESHGRPRLLIGEFGRGESMAVWVMWHNLDLQALADRTR